MQNVRRTFLRLFFQLLYNEFAWSYDLVAWLVSLGQWKAWGQTALLHLQGERVLELGHGPGHLLVTMANRGLMPVGLDLSPSMARRAKRRLCRSDVDAPLVRARAKALPFRTRSFDSIVATFPAEFITQYQTLLEAKRVLASRGNLIIALAAQFEGGGLAMRFLAWLYGVTGQNQPSFNTRVPWVEEAGFSSHVVWEDVDRSRVMLIIAEQD